MLSLNRVICNFMDVEPDRELFMDSFDVDDHVTQMEDLFAKDGTDLFLTCHHIYQGKFNYHLGNYTLAVDHLKKAEKTIEGVQGTPNQVLFNYYYALSLMAYAIQGNDVSLKQRLFLRGQVKEFKKLSKINPDNYKTSYMLLRAEYALYSKQLNQAQEYYAEAKTLSKSTQFVQTLALINERFARFYLSRGLTDIATPLLKTAYENNKDWGANAKTRLLKEEFPKIDFESSGSTNFDNPHYYETTSSSLDLQSIFKASTTISGEIVFENLARKLLQIIIENAGAQKVYLIINNGGKLQAEAYSNYEDNQVELLNGKPISDVDDIAKTMVHLVFHTGETVISNDASTDSRFSKDEYVIEQDPKSVLCMPIKQHGNTLAILYLENNIASGAFTPSRLELLNLLSGQMAISLENSLLYENLENKVRERTATIENQKQEIEAEKEKSDSLLLNILPHEIAEELKATGQYKPRKYENVSIMFTDFEGFTKLSEQISTEDLVEMIDYCYRGFDKITTKYNIEKIKTIGDAYMCVSGLPVENEEHGLNAVKAAIAMMKFKIGRASCRERV